MKNVKYIFCIVFCLGMMNGVMAQSSTDLSALEKQLCFIQDTLYTLRQNYSCTNDAYCDSLQRSFSVLLEELCAADKGMEYDFKELKKKERQFTVAASADGTMRVFSRNTYFGGSMPRFASYIQHKDEGQSCFFRMNGEDDMGVCYDTVYSVQAADKRYYLLAGTSRIATAYPLAAMQAVSCRNGKMEKESIFVSDNRQTDYLSVSYRVAQEDIDARLFIGNDDSTFPRIVYIGTLEKVLKPVVVRDKDGEEYVSREIEVYKLERDGDNIKFISNKVGKQGKMVSHPISRTIKQQ